MEPYPELHLSSFACPLRIDYALMITLHLRRSFFIQVTTQLLFQIGKLSLAWSQKGTVMLICLLNSKPLNLEAVILSDIWFPTSVMAIPASLAFLPLAT